MEQSDRVLAFLACQGPVYGNQYTLEGKALSVDHSTGLVALAGVAALAAHRAIGKLFVRELRETKIPHLTWQYFNGLL